MASPKIIVEILGDASKFNAATKGAVKTGGRMGATMKKVAVGATLVTGALVAGGIAVFKMGSKMEALDNKAQTVFGDSLPIVNKWAKESAGAMGLTAREATGLAANMADLLVPMGFARDDAAKFSTEVVGLSGALSEWCGGTRTAAEVAEVLQKALLGERDGLKALGISITEADVKAQLMKDGTDELTGAALEQAKAMATQTLIFAKTEDAQASYAAGTNKGLRTQNEMNAKLKEVGDTLVSALFPALSVVAGFLADNLSPALAFLGGVFAEVQAVVEPIAKVVFPILGKAIGTVANVVRALLPVVKTVFGVIGGIVGFFVDLFKTQMGVFAAVAGAVGDVFRGIASIVGTVFGSIARIIKRAINGVISIVNGVIRGINSIQVHIEVGPVKYDFDGLNLKKIPRLHSGGVVPGAAGTEVLTMLQAGETVTPAGGKMGQTINVFIESFIGSDSDIDRFADKVALRLRTA